MGTGAGGGCWRAGGASTSGFGLESGFGLAFGEGPREDDDGATSFSVDVPRSLLALALCRSIVVTDGGPVLCAPPSTLPAVAEVGAIVRGEFASLSASGSLSGCISGEFVPSAMPMAPKTGAGLAPTNGLLSPTDSNSITFLRAGTGFFSGDSNETDLR